MASQQKFVVALSNITSKDKTNYGIPALELAELMQANVPIPAGFVVTQKALETFAHQSQLDQKVKQLQQIGSFSEATLTKLILESELPQEVYDDLYAEYTSLSGITNIWMRMRAGLYDQEGAPLTFLDEDELAEFKGFEALEFELKKVWAQLLIIDQKYDSLGSFVIIQKLIPAEVSGKIMTEDLMSNNADHIVIQGMYGEYSQDLLDSDDIYVFSKSEEKIIDRSINPQSSMYIRSNKNDTGYELVEISPKWQIKQKLSDKHIEDLGYLGDYLQHVFAQPQDIFWIYQAGKIWINYVKPLSLEDWEKEIQEKTNPQDTEVSEDDLPINDNLEQEIDQDLERVEEIVEEQAVEYEEKIVDIEDTEEIPSELEDDNIEIEMPEIEDKPQELNVKMRANSIAKDVLVVGIGNNKGIVQGKVVFNRDESTIKDILVLPEWDDMPKIAAAVIVEDFLNITSDIPVVYGADLASKILREGEYIQADTDTGFVFELPNTLHETNNEEVADEPEIQHITETKAANTHVEEEEIQTAIKVYAHTNTVYKDSVKNRDGYILNLPHSESLFTEKNSINFNTFKSMIRDFIVPYAESTDNTIIYNIIDCSPATYIKNSDLLEIQCEALHKVRNKDNLRNVNILLPKFKSLKQLRTFRKSLSVAGLRKSQTFKIYIKLSYASNVFELKDYLEDKFDGVVVSLRNLYNGLYSSNRKVVRLTNTLITTLEHIEKDCKAAKVPMILDLKGVKVTKSLMEKLAPFISFAIAVSPKDKREGKIFISELEKERIFKNLKK